MVVDNYQQLGFMHNRHLGDDKKRRKEDWKEDLCEVGWTG